MRDAVKKLGGDPQKINPVCPTDLVIDHSVQVDVSRRWEKERPEPSSMPKIFYSCSHGYGNLWFLLPYLQKSLHTILLYFIYTFARLILGHCSHMVCLDDWKQMLLEYFRSRVLSCGRLWTHIGVHASICVSMWFYEGNILKCYVPQDWTISECSHQ